MIKTIKKIFVWALLATVFVLIATHNSPMVAHIWADILGPLGSFFSTLFHNVVHHAPHVHVN